jgi:RNA polymerase sigma factor (sigma-70 family)
MLMGRHEPLVIYAVNRQNLGRMPFEEGVQAGREGLWYAIMGFDPHRGNQFSTYAYVAIVRRIWRAVKVNMRHNQRAGEVGELRLYMACWQEGPGRLRAQRELRKSVNELVDRLPKRLKKVIRASYGLDGVARKSYREIGIEFGVSKQRIQQLHVAALVWLRHPSHSQELREVLQRHSQQEYEWAEEMAQAWLRQRGGRRGHPK